MTGGMFRNFRYIFKYYFYVLTTPSSRSSRITKHMRWTQIITLNTRVYNDVTPSKG